MTLPVVELDHEHLVADPLQGVRPVRGRAVQRARVGDVLHGSVITGRKTYLQYSPPSFLDDRHIPRSATGSGSPKTPSGWLRHYIRRWPPGRPGLDLSQQRLVICRLVAAARVREPRHQTGGQQARKTSRPGEDRTVFSRTVREQFFVEITEQVAANISGLTELNRLLAAWMETIYHTTIH